MIPPSFCYLDANATTPVRSEVLSAMAPYWQTYFGNPQSATHALGWQAKASVDVAREDILKDLKAPPKSHLIFTGSATEANNLVIKGLFENAPLKSHFMTASTEHDSVLASADYLKKRGYPVTVLPVNKDGFIDVDHFKKALTPDTLLVSFMMCNNEIGTLQNIKELCQITHDHSKAYFHTDAVQALGKIPVSVSELKIDFLTLSAHKMEGPKGVGALYVVPHVKLSELSPQMLGGGQEQSLRSSTLNVPMIVGMAKALSLATQEQDSVCERLKIWQKRFFETFLKFEHVLANGSLTNRVCHNINVTLPGIPAEALIRKLPQLGFSMGSACGSSKTTPSHVLLAIGKSTPECFSSVRFGLGRYNTDLELSKALQDIEAALLTFTKK